MIGLYYLILGGLYLLVGLFMIRWLMRIPEKRKNKVLVAIITFFIWLLIPTYDEILGRIYFNHLCKTEAGVKVYKTIELPAEYWDENGKAKFMNSRGVWDKEILGDRLEWKRQTEPAMSGLIKIDRKISIIYDKKVNQELGARIDYWRHFGWLNTFSSAPYIAESCQSMRGEKSSQRHLMSIIFVKPAN